MTEETNNYRTSDFNGLGIIDRTMSIATLVVCYILTILSVFILLLLLVSVTEDEHFPLWLWITLFSVIVYGSGGVVVLHIYLENGHGKNWVTFYKITVGIIVTLIVIAIFKSEDK